nr:unnamed protein product [Callosobruchus chinensis]
MSNLGDRLKTSKNLEKSSQELRSSRQKPSIRTSLPSTLAKGLLNYRSLPYYKQGFRRGRRQPQQTPPLQSKLYLGSPNLHMFGFPSDPILRQKWIAAVPRENFTPVSSSKVTSPEEEHYPGCRAIIREALERRDIPHLSTDICLASVSDSTHKQYNVGLKR